MTKLDIEEAIEITERQDTPTQKDRDAVNLVCDAARSYAALLKLAPEIGALVEAGEKAGDSNATCTPHDHLAHEFITQMTQSTPTLKAIHEILTKGGV